MDLSLFFFSLQYTVPGTPFHCDDNEIGRQKESKKPQLNSHHTYEPSVEKSPKKNSNKTDFTQKTPNKHLTI